VSTWKREFLALLGFAALMFITMAEGVEAQATNTVYQVELRDGFEGTAIHFPIGRERVGAVIVLHGSEGGANGNARFRAHWLAQFGFVTLALPYSNGGNQWHAGDIADVELDRTERAIAWLRGQNFSNGKVGLAGYSRGAEHALLLATLMAKDNPSQAPNAVAVHAPTDVVVRDFHSEGILPNRPTAFRQPRSAWSWRGSPAGLGVGVAIEKSSGMKERCTSAMERMMTYGRYSERAT
jgi:poly(3-hydroxybutyrate) depolymerase